MSLTWLIQMAVVAACIFLSGTESAPCINTVMDVASSADAQDLADALNCTGEGEFNVNWYGNVAIRRTFDVADGISLNVTGKNYSILSLGSDEGRATIVGDDITSETGIFFVSGHSTLTLSNLVLQGGHSKTEDGGGAVEAQGSADANQTVNLIDCLFAENTGNYSGGIFANHSVVNMYGTTTFLGNTGVRRAGAVFGNYARINLYGASMFLYNTGEIGGGVFAFRSDIAFGASATFTNNTSRLGGGAMYAILCDVGFGGTSTFSNNTSSTAGAFWASSSNITFNESATFTNNTSGSSAGAIFASSSDIGFGASATFTNNTSRLSGGAVSASGSDIIFNESATFTNNTSGFTGGAVSASGSDIIFNESATFTSNNASAEGGALYVSLSDITFNESATFTNNTSSSDGGAVIAGSSVIRFGASSTFTNNTCDSSGGAILVFQGNISFNKRATFTNNTSGDDGGALFAIDSDITFNESATFTNHTSGENGGAIFLRASTMTVGGGINFTTNTAFFNGGAIHAQETNLAIDGFDFTGNSALDKGGALYVESSNLRITGATNFTRNLASRSGGGFYSTDSNTVNISGEVSFVENFAFTDGGAISINVGGDVFVEGATFILNEAAAGGASSIVATDQDIFVDIYFRWCTFDKNTATEGGALYLFNSAQSVEVHESVFRNNTAVSSGGAIYHTGELELNGTRFLANQAGVQGLAVNSLGELSFARNTSFGRNARYCLPGEYGYDKNLEMDDQDTCRAEVVCSRCSDGCDDDILEGVTFLSNSTVPAADCKVLPVGTDASGAGTTLATLNLAKGYYRTSNESHIVLMCYQKDACTGGIDADNYCAAGYRGPYCAVCEDNYAPGVAYSCHKCSGPSLGYVVGLVLSTLMVILGGLAVAVGYLVAVVSVGGSAEEEQEPPRGCWKRRLLSCHSFLMKVFPLTSMKVIVVVWQILTQFGAIAGAVYPDEYQAFLSNLSSINLDIGFLLSFSCVADTDFYDRLLLTTTMPLVVFAVLGGTYAIAKKRNKGYELAIRAVQHKHIAAALFVTFFMYSSVSFTVFQTFVCDSIDDGVEYLRADYSISCWSDQHRRYVGYASVMVFVYPIGIPTGFICWLTRNRHELAKPDRETVVHLQPFSGLWAAYRPSRFYYEVVEYCRRVALTGIAVFIFPGSAAQIAVVLLLSVVFSFISETLQPFSNNVEMWLYRWGNGIVMASMYVALLLKFDASGEDSSVESAFAGVLIAANVFMIVAVLIQSALLVLDWRVGENVVEVVEPRVHYAHTSSVRIIPVVGDTEEAKLNAAGDHEKRTEPSVS